MRVFIYYVSKETFNRGSGNRYLTFVVNEIVNNLPKHCFNLKICANSMSSEENEIMGELIRVGRIEKTDKGYSYYMIDELGFRIEKI